MLALRNNGDAQPRYSIVLKCAAKLETPTKLEKLRVERPEETAERTIFGLPPETARQVALLLASQFTLFLGVGALLPALPLYGKELGLTGAKIGLVLSVPAFAMTLLNFPAGSLADRVGRKKVMITGLVILAAGDLFSGLSTSLFGLVPARLLVGIGRAGSETGSSAYWADITDRFPAQRGRLLAAQQVVLAAGLVVGPAVGGALTNTYGTSSAFFAVTAGALLAAVGYSFLPETSPRQLPEAAGTDAAPDVGIQWQEVIRDPKQQAVAVITSVFYLGLVAKASIVPNFASDTLDATPAQIGALFSAVAGIGVLCGPLGGVLTDSIGSRKTILLAAAFTGIGYGGVQLIDSYEGLVAWMVIWGAGVSLKTSALQSFIIEVAPPGKTAQMLSLPKTIGINKSTPLSRGRNA
ncbi:hypothetical protein CYMTET_11594 [Cymbomonas tetramitiformis]|uniref:Major facilitator superfamily (MFS) profile domain-containing protein n=1 Tax=Cymbomonas tetramitiformis TaxID=36881 RepID=A0AAE0GM19_9CHLO|nr:hypothetical protein CYMTET_11594 [Cymbomonas tetramitiformis]